MAPAINHQAEPTNAGFRLADSERLRHTRSAYARLLEQMAFYGAGDVATWNVERYLIELDAELAAREAVGA